MLELIEGNLIKLACSSHEKIVMHGCNCFCTMGAGVARAIAHCFPEAAQVDQQTQSGDIRKMGTFTEAYCTKYRVRICNLYTQFGYGRYGVKGRIRIAEHEGKEHVQYLSYPREVSMPQLDLKALELALEAVLRRYGAQHRQFLMPKIGCMLGGEKWDHVQPLVEKLFVRERLTVVHQGR